MSDIINRLTEEEEVVAATDKYLTFILDKQNYAVPISEVREIIPIQDVTQMPDYPAYVKGIINVRGTIIPLIDIRVRFHKPDKAYDERTSVVVALINELLIGLIVDAVDEVLDIDKNDISPSPRMNADTTSKYVTGVGKVENKIILILDTNKLLNDEELTGIAEII